MIIEKSASNPNNYLIHEYYYDRARDGMFDLFNNMISGKIIDTVFLPGYIGWSPKEGSGIFDPIFNLHNLSIQFYKMTSALDIDYKDLFDRIEKTESKKFAVLVVNYFGFVDSKIKDIYQVVKKHSGWLIEDNAHGFFTYQCIQECFSDATFFSLHKMFPYKNGGSLFINNTSLASYKYNGICQSETKFNPWKYDVSKIARTRRKNYSILDNVIKKEKTDKYFMPLKYNGLDLSTVPQTFPICIIKGNRDEIYELMNKAGYGVISLYHTLIKPLYKQEYKASIDLSKCIMNLPIHQDVVTKKYTGMVRLLIKLCEETSENNKKGELL